MAERRVIVASQHGLHARPAALFTQAAAASGLAVTVTKNGKSVKAASILGVISLGVDRNDEITLSAEGANAENVLDELATLLSTDFDAPDVTTSTFPTPADMPMPIAAPGPDAMPMPFATPVPGTTPVPSATPLPGTPAAPIPAPSIADAPTPTPNPPDAPITPPY